MSAEITIFYSSADTTSAPSSSLRLDRRAAQTNFPLQTRAGRRYTISRRRHQHDKADHRSLEAHRPQPGSHQLIQPLLDRALRRRDGQHGQSRRPTPVQGHHALRSRARSLPRRHPVLPNPPGAGEHGARRRELTRPRRRRA